MKGQPLHKAVALLLQEAVQQSGYTLVLDPACGGRQRIPLFGPGEKCRGSQYCHADALIFDAAGVRVIVEIEESSVIPTQMCGKFLTSAIAEHYTHVGHGTKLLRETLFVQVLDTAGLKQGRTAKPAQWKRLEDALGAIAKSDIVRVAKYRVFHGSKADFTRATKVSSEFVAAIKNHLGIR
jgi:hypothetical protein